MEHIELSIPGEVPYEIVLGQGILPFLGEELEALSVSGSLMVITDTEVGKRYLPTLKNALEKTGFQVSVVTVPSGEEAKSVQCAAEVWRAMADCKLSRDSYVLTLGGGVVGDLAGFCASTFMRGLQVVQIPTTLLSMVDSSVGGKTAINLDLGKNLVGSFWQPAMVYADISLLQSLPEREWACGCGEIVKSAVIDSPSFFDWLTSHSDGLQQRDPEVVQEAIKRCVTFKASVVTRDKNETAGVRECLNYGHTLAHAIEAFSGYGVYSHGHAVAQGMRFASRLAAGLGYCDFDFVCAQDELLDRFGLTEITLNGSSEELLALMKVDKKVRHGVLRFVLPFDYGVWEVQDLSDELVDQYLQAWLASQQH